MPGLRERSCGCSKRFRVEIAKQHEYARVKALLNKGRHPAFIGRNYFDRIVHNGGVFVAKLGDSDLAVAMINTRRNLLNVLCVHPDHRSHGLGSTFLAYLKPPIVRATSKAVSWFEARGYLCVGEPKKGYTLTVSLMVHEDVKRLAGRVSRVFQERLESARQRNQSAPTRRRRKRRNKKRRAPRRTQEADQ